jgi:hypothetical protein
MAGLVIAERVWAMTKQLLGDYPAAQKLAWATAASKEWAYLVVMGGSKNFTLIHHHTVLNVELRPKDPILGRVVAFEAEMRDDGAPPRLVVFDGPAADLFPLIRPRLGSRSTADNTYVRAGPSDESFIGVRDPSAITADWPAATACLIPIPMAWAAYFVDYPPFGVAVRQLNSLMDSVARLE